VSSFIRGSGDSKSTTAIVMRANMANDATFNEIDSTDVSVAFFGDL
jgi:hypothetical protein